MQWHARQREVLARHGDRPSEQALVEDILTRCLNRTIPQPLSQAEFERVTERYSTTASPKRLECRMPTPTSLAEDLRYGSSSKIVQGLQSEVAAAASDEATAGPQKPAALVRSTTEKTGAAGLLALDEDVIKLIEVRAPSRFWSMSRRALTCRAVLPHSSASSGSAS